MGDVIGFLATATAFLTVGVWFIAFGLGMFMEAKEMEPSLFGTCVLLTVIGSFCVVMGLGILIINCIQIGVSA